MYMIDKELSACRKCKFYFLEVAGIFFQIFLTCKGKPQGYRAPATEYHPVFLQS